MFLQNGNIKGVGYYFSKHSHNITWNDVIKNTRFLLLTDNNNNYQTRGRENTRNPLFNHLYYFNRFFFLRRLLDV
jgi:hypothetical protein